MLKSLALMDTSEESKTLKPKVLLNLANYYFNIADYQNAIKFYNELLNSLPESESNPELYFGIAVAFEKILNYQKANEFYQKVINSDTTSQLTPKALLTRDCRKRRKRGRKGN